MIVLFHCITGERDRIDLEEFLNDRSRCQPALCNGRRGQRRGRSFRLRVILMLVQNEQTMTKVTTKAAVTVVALVAMLVFAAPSFASTIYIDFTGGNTSPFLHTPTLTKSGSGATATLTGNYIPISIVGVSDSSLVPLTDFEVTNAYLWFSLNTSSLTGTLKVKSPTDLDWFTGNVDNFRQSVSTNPKTGITSYTLDEFTGSASLTPDGLKLLSDHGVPIAGEVTLDSQSHVYLKLKNSKVIFNDVNVTLDPVPEPLTAALILPGIAFLGFVRRRFLA